MTEAEQEARANTHCWAQPLLIPSPPPPRVLLLRDRRQDPRPQEKGVTSMPLARLPKEREKLPEREDTRSQTRLLEGHDVGEQACGATQSGQGRMRRRVSGEETARAKAGGETA